jgi:hypothetical protein
MHSTPLAVALSSQGCPGWYLGKYVDFFESLKWRIKVNNQYNIKYFIKKSILLAILGDNFIA